MIPEFDVFISFRRNGILIKRLPISLISAFHVSKPPLIPLKGFLSICGDWKKYSMHTKPISAALAKEIENNNENLINDVTKQLYTTDYPVE